MTEGQAERTRRAYDEGGVWESCDRWNSRARHVIECPNSRRNYNWIEGKLASLAPGRRVLEIGCYDGKDSLFMSEAGADYVLGIDVAESAIATAKDSERPGVLEFRVANALELDLEEPFDLIFARTVLHHIDYRRFLSKAYAEYLRPGGTMLFLEPLGTNLITRVFRALVRSAHTPDEFTFRRSDLDWLVNNFPKIEMRPVNYLSYPAGIISSFIFKHADNWLTRWADRVDVRLARRFPRLKGHYRQMIFLIEKPA